MAGRPMRTVVGRVALVALLGLTAAGCVGDRGRNDGPTGVPLKNPDAEGVDESPG